MSDSHKIIKSSISSPASYSNRLIAESVMSSLERPMGRRCSSTSFFTYFILSPKGSLSAVNILGTIRPPTTSCPWKVQPWPSSNFFVAGFAMSCRMAAQRNHKSLDFFATLSNTCRVWKKLSLWPKPSIYSAPASSVINGKMGCSRLLSNNNLKPMEGLSDKMILFSSSVIRSCEIIFILVAASFIASKVFGSM